MTPFDSCVAALRSSDTPALFKALDAALKQTVGHKLFTLLYVAPNGLRVKRIYTNLGVFDVTARGFEVRDMVPGLSREKLQSLSGAKLHFPE